MSQAIDFLQKVSKDAAGEITELIGGAGEFVRKHPVTSAVTLGGGVLAATQVIRIVKKRKAAKKAAPKKKAKKKAAKKTTRRKRSKLSWQLDRARISKQKHEVAYQRRKKALKSTSKKRVGKVYYTKKGQPYVMLRNGRAKFIKKSKRRTR
ncbi:hypothetical protein ES703_70256 [subsurface metagenome]